MALIIFDDCCDVVTKESIELLKKVHNNLKPDGNKFVTIVPIIPTNIISANSRQSLTYYYHR